MRCADRGALFVALVALTSFWTSLRFPSLEACRFLFHLRLTSESYQSDIRGQLATNSFSHFQRAGTGKMLFQTPASDPDSVQNLFAQQIVSGPAVNSTKKLSNVASATRKKIVSAQFCCLLLVPLLHLLLLPACCKTAPSPFFLGVE